MVKENNTTHRGSDSREKRGGCIPTDGEKTERSFPCIMAPNMCRSQKLKLTVIR